MTATVALLTTITLTLVCTMMPRIVWVLFKVEHLSGEGELWRLRLLQADENRWARRHLKYGILVAVLAWAAKTSPLEVPVSEAAGLALYAAASLLFALADSLIAQRIDTVAQHIPIRIKARQ